jgi:hypothetical protein
LLGHRLSGGKEDERGEESGLEHEAGILAVRRR